MSPRCIRELEQVRESIIVLNEQRREVNVGAGLACRLDYHVLTLTDNGEVIVCGLGNRLEMWIGRHANAWLGRVLG
jgi:hypothetical protein